MSRNNKLRPTEKQRRKERQARAARQAQPSQFNDICRRASQWIAASQWEPARQALEAYDRDHPFHGDVLRQLLEVYRAERQFGLYCRTCQRLIEHAPSDRELRLLLADGYLNDHRPVKSLQVFLQFLDLWPNDPLAEGVRDHAANLEVAIFGTLQNTPFEGGDNLDLAALHEEVLASMSAGEYRRVVEIGEQLLGHCPNFAPVMNNLSEAYFNLDRAGDALTMSRAVLARDSTNIHALANLTRHLFVCGHRDEAEQYRQRLRAAHSQNPDIWIKKAETYSFFGADQDVLDVFAEARREGYTNGSSSDVAMFHHFAAVAAARLNDAEGARLYWLKAVKTLPNFKLARENLDDIRRPVEDRHGPWPYTLDYWVGTEGIAKIRAAFEGIGGLSEVATANKIRRFFEAHPEFVLLVPVLLDRGDEHTRKLVWTLAKSADTPPLRDALRDFCFSTRGPDRLRIETVELLRGRGVIPRGSVRIWRKGEWSEFEMLGFEVSDEPTSEERTGQVGDWAYDAQQALLGGDGVTAETLLRKCLDAAGDAPDLLNNLAAAYNVQGRRNDARRLAREIHERWPDYFFGRVAMAVEAVFTGDFERAEEFLVSLRSQGRYHTTEFIALAMASIQLANAQGDGTATETWLGLLRQVAPDNPQVKQIEAMCAPVGVLRRFSRLLTGRKPARSRASP